MKKGSNCIAYALISVAAVVGILYTNTMSRNAAKYPKFILFLILGLSLILLIKEIVLMLKDRKVQPTAAETAAEGIEEIKPASKGFIFPAKEWGVMGIAVLYVILLNLIGFLPASLIAFVGLSVFIGYRKWLPLAIVTVCAVALTYFLFFRYLNLAYISGSLFR